MMEYLKRRTSLPYEVNVFTSTEKLLRYAPEERVLLLVISESEYARGLQDRNYDPILILNESDRYLGGDMPVNISKYQSMKVIADRIAEIISEREDYVPASIRHGPPMKIIGVYTPVTRCLQTTFSLTLGQLLSENHKALYLNFENYSGLDIMLGRMFKGSAADLLYYNECAREKVAVQLSSMVENINGLDFIPPMRSFIELRSIRARQWLDLFHTIEQVTEYEYLILDLTEATDGLLEILRACDEVYMIEREDALSQARIRHYELLLRENEYEDICLKMYRWKFPVFHELPATLEYLTHGEFSDYIRKKWNESHRRPAVGY